MIENNQLISRLLLVLSILLLFLVRENHAKQRRRRRRRRKGEDPRDVESGPKGSGGGIGGGLYHSYVDVTPLGESVAAAVPTRNRKKRHTNNGHNNNNNDDDDDAGDDDDDIQLKELKEILQNAGRNPRLAVRMLQDFDKDQNGGLSTKEYEVFLRDRKNPNKFQRKARRENLQQSISNVDDGKNSYYMSTRKITTRRGDLQQLLQEFDAAQEKMQKSLAALESGNIMEFSAYATSARIMAKKVLGSKTMRKALRQIEKMTIFTPAVEGSVAAEAEEEEEKDTWPPWITHVHRTSAKYFHAIASHTGERTLLQKALVLQREVLSHTVRGSGPSLHAYIDSLVETSQLEIETAHFCRGINILKDYVSLRQELHLQQDPNIHPNRDALESLPIRSVQQFTLASHGCDVHLSRELFGHLEDMKYLEPHRPDVCTKCWGIRGIVLREIGDSNISDQYFYQQLKPHVPWVHSHQLPSTFNVLLATKVPENFWSLTSSAKNVEVPTPNTMMLLRENRAMIMAEYNEYERLVALGAASVQYDTEHEDSWMSRKISKEGNNEERWWGYLRLRQANGQWDDQLCSAHFPQTCHLFKGSVEISGPYPENAKCEGYCPSPTMPGQHRSTGMISFYHLGANRTVREHSGGDNMRLKCHLVIRAPPKNETNPAFIQVSDTKRTYSTGETFCFDDSFYHSVSNGGGKFRNETRVVLDVAVWHPNLYKM